MASSSETNSAVFKGCISPKGCIIKVVLGDLGNAELANPAVRAQLKAKHGVVRICTPEYRPPDMWLGNTAFDQALDMWSLGCVAVELNSRTPLFSPQARAPCAIDYLRLHLCNLGAPSVDAMAFLNQLESLPCDIEQVRRAASVSLPRGQFLRFLHQRDMADFAVFNGTLHAASRLHQPASIRSCRHRTFL